MYVHLKLVMNPGPVSAGRPSSTVPGRCSKYGTKRGAWRSALTWRPVAACWSCTCRN